MKRHRNKTAVEQHAGVIGQHFQNPGQVPWQPLSGAILFVMSYAILFVESHPIPNQEAPISIFSKVGNQKTLTSGLTPPPCHRSCPETIKLAASPWEGGLSVVCQEVSLLFLLCPSQLSPFFSKFSLLKCSCQGNSFPAYTQSAPTMATCKLHERV